MNKKAQTVFEEDVSEQTTFYLCAAVALRALSLGANYESFVAEMKRKGLTPETTGLTQEWLSHMASLSKSTGDMLMAESQEGLYSEPGQFAI